MKSHSKKFVNPRIGSLASIEDLKHFNWININNPGNFFWSFETGRAPTDKVPECFWVWPMHL